MGLARLIALLARHGSSYAELMSGAFVELRRVTGTRLTFVVFGLVLGTSGLAACWAALVLILWESPSRNAVAGSFALLMLLGGAFCLWRAAQHPEPGPQRSRLSRELKLDLELLQEWKRQNP